MWFVFDETGRLGVVLSFSGTFEQRFVDMKVQSFYICTNGSIIEHIDILVEHLTSPIDVSNHKDLVVWVEILSQDFCKLGFTVRNDTPVPESMNAFA